MTDTPAAPTTPQNHNAETWIGLVNAIQRFARTRSDLDWPAVEQAMRDRDAFHRADIEAEARSTPAEALDEDESVALRAAPTRRMFARALGGGEHPNDEYLSMATAVLDKVATEVEDKPWLT